MICKNASNPISKKEAVIPRKMNDHSNFEEFYCNQENSKCCVDCKSEANNKHAELSMCTTFKVTLISAYTYSNSTLKLQDYKNTCTYTFSCKFQSLAIMP